MIKKLFLLLLATYLSANPKIYSALGDVIYNNVKLIEELKKIPEFNEHNSKIDSYIVSVNRAKKIGFAIETDSADIDKNEYFKSIRELSKANDMFHRYVEDLYKESVEKESVVLWDKLVNSGLLDIEKYKFDILEFYFANSAHLNKRGIIQTFLDKDENLKTKKQNGSLSEKKEQQEESIKRIREKDNIQQEVVDKKLELEHRKN